MSDYEDAFHSLNETINSLRAQLAENPKAERKDNLEASLREARVKLAQLTSGKLKERVRKVAQAAAALKVVMDSHDSVTSASFMNELDDATEALKDA